MVTDGRVSPWGISQFRMRRSYSTERRSTVAEADTAGNGRRLYKSIAPVLWSL